MLRRIGQGSFHAILSVLGLAFCASLLTATGKPTSVAAGSLPPANKPGVGVSCMSCRTFPIVGTAASFQTQVPPAGRRARFEHISTADGLSFPIVRDILQDRRGFLWIATDGGLNRYDGYTFTVYREDPGDPTTIRFDDVRVIYEDSDGTLWVGGGGGLDRFDRTTETFTHVDTRGQVFAITEDSSGTLWVGFWHGLYGYDRSTDEIIFSTQPDPSTPDDWQVRTLESAVQAIQEDRAGYLWLGTPVGMYRLDRTNGTFEHYRSAPAERLDPQDPNSPGSNSIQAIVEDSQGNLWIAAYGGGIDRLEPSTGIFDHYRHDPDVPNSLATDEVLSLLQDSAGTLWIGTTTGLERFDPDQGRFLHYGHDPQDAQSLSDNTVLALFEDRSGVLWVGTVDGLNKDNRREAQFLCYQQDPDPPAEPSYSLDVSGRLQDPQPAILSDDRILAVHEDRGGVLWIGTFDGGLNRLDRKAGRLTVYRHDPADAASLSSNMASTVYQDRAGVLWVGTGNGWLERFDPQTETFDHHRRLGESRLTAIAEDWAGNLWVGSSAEGLYCLDGDRLGVEHFPQYWRDADHWWREGSLSSHIVSVLQVDRSGQLWAGTIYGGVNLRGEGEDRFTHLRYDPGDPGSLSHDQVLSLWEDPVEGVVWIGTAAGLNRFDPATRTMTSLTEADGLFSDVVGCILIDDAGYLWLATVKGLSRFDVRTETFRSYDKRDGVGVLSAGQVAPGSCVRSQSGEMLFGGLNGLYIFEPAQIEVDQNPPLVAITTLKVLNQTMRSELAPGEHVRLPYQDNFVSFEFAALDYTMPERNQYAYMLEGLDRHWVYAGTRRYADYPDLKPGDYLFRVRAANSDGVWNEDGTAVRITLEPPFWDTWPFRGLVAVALILGTLGVYRLRVRNVEARSRELERMVEERTHEIEQRRRVAEGLRDILAVLNSDRPLDEVLDYIIIQAAQLLGAQAALLYTRESGGRLLSIQASSGLPAELEDVGSIPLEISWAGEAISSGRPHAIPDLATAAVSRDLDCDPLAGRWLAATRQRYRSFLAVPLPPEGEVIHCLAFYYAEPQAISEEDLGLAVTLADQAALAIENARLYEQAQALSAMEERQRLARELHDAVSQTLFSASLIAETLPALWETDPEEGEQLLEKLQQLSRGALAEMRTLLMELRPSALTEASMTDLLRQLGQAASGREGIPVTVIADASCAMPADVQIALYRIAQEALNNVVKHAQASRVDVHFRCAPDISPAGQSKTLELLIRDDGLGFEPGTISQERLGLGIMHERAAAIGAWLEIESQVGRGTEVRVRWPADRVGREEETIS